MADRTLSRSGWLLAALLAALFLLPAAAGVSRADDAPEILKGTVVEFKDGVLTLKGVRFQDETIPAQNVRIRTDKDTVYNDGPQQVTKEAIVPDLIVLVRCTIVVSERKALLIRIIGGKKS